jgi:hypothetical protein
VRRAPWLAGALLAGGCAALATAEDLPSPEAPVTTAALATAPVGAPAVPVPVPPPPAAPARDCIAHPAAHAAARWATEVGDALEPGTELETWPLPDVDGDGRQERMLVAEVQCGVTGNCPRLLYLSGADGGEDCWTYAGSLWTAMVDVAQDGPSNPRDLITWTKGGCAGMEGGWARLSFRDGSYRVSRSVECDCPYGEDGEVIVHLAPSEGSARAPECPEP